MFSRRVLMVTGKGGVGKTTIVAALGSLAAQQGKRVLVVDMEKTLETPSTLLQLLSGPANFVKDEPHLVQSSLWCARLTPRGGHLQFLSEQLRVQMIAKAALRSKILSRFLMATPGFQELGVIYRLLPYLRVEQETGRPPYDLVILDLPATGHALAMTSLPEPFLEIFSTGPIEKAIREAQSYFYDPHITAAVVVTLPEPLPVSETFELLSGLERDQVPVAGILVNRLPQDPWNAEEHTTLHSFFQQHSQRFAGEWMFRRVMRAQEAIHRLQHGLDAHPSWGVLGMLDEQWGASPQQCLTFAKNALRGGQKQ
ncbi:MAG: ArsA family ATPase [Myxococcota bacterium]